jgi:hypothetical protein
MARAGGVAAVLSRPLSDSGHAPLSAEARDKLNSSDWDDERDAPVVPLGIIDFTGTIRQSGVTWRRVAGDALVPDTMGQGSCHFLEWNFCCAFPSFTADRLPCHPIRALIQLCRMASFTRSSLNPMIH